VPSSPSSLASVEGPPRPPPTSALRLLGLLRWWLPITLCVIGLYAEWNEHIAAEQEPITAYFVGEVLIFSIAGPVAVWFTLTWVARLVAEYQATANALADVNRDLETTVVDRTRHLQAASEQLQIANADLERANRELRQLDRMKSEFVSLVSHQLRAPLTNINGALELVAQDATALPPSSQRTLQILGEESRRLSRLIQTILDVSRLEAGRLELHLGPVALEPLLARTASSTLDAEPRRAWLLEATAGLPPAWADELLLEEAVRNLIENAARYWPSEEPIELTASHVGDSLEVSVTDHGPGVPPEEQEHIFESFHRVGEVETAVPGYGLGLYFAKRLIGAQHGTIGVESPLGPDGARGSRFWFQVPIARGGPDEEDDAPWAEIAADPASGVRS
jgi:signal transduction histidine kinase